MTVAATFLGGAKSRLLPASIPLRFFVAAALFHCLAWLMLLLAADELPGYAGGLGRPLAAVHLLTLGVLVMTAIGAAFQLLPVATVQPLHRLWPARTVFWLAVPSVVVLTYGMSEGDTRALAAGAAGIALAMLVFAVAIADNLRRARSLPLVAAHGWAALAALFAVLLLGVLLAVNSWAGLLPDQASAALAHFILAAYGFMGLLALGFSYVLVPMFAMSPAPPRLPGWIGFWLALAGLAVGTAGALLAADLLLAAAAVLGLGAAGCHLASMAWVWKRRLRKRMGLSFVLVRVAWPILPAGLLVGLALASGVPVPGGAALFGFLVLVGWLLTFLMGILQRILPFLASMHAGGSGGRPARVSELTPDLPLKLHAGCHLAAMAVMSVGMIAGSAALLRLGAAAGLAAALAFCWFVLAVMLRLRAPRSR